MPSIITASELRSALNGVSSSLYSDAILDEIIDTAESVVGNLLVQHNAAIAEHSSKDNVWTNYTTKPHKFYVGQTVTVTDSHHPGVTGTKVITEIPDEFSFKFAQTHADFDRHWTIPNGLAAANGLSQYADVAPVESAVLTVSLDVFKARTSAGSSQNGLDFVPAPYILGRTIQNRIVGMLGAYIDVEALIG